MIRELLLILRDITWHALHTRRDDGRGLWLEREET